MPPYPEPWLQTLRLDFREFVPEDVEDIVRLDAVGYADRIGEEPYNVPLSRKRAEAVVAYLAGKGVEATRIRAEAKGESEATTGDACKDLGPDSATNQRLVKCLERDRRVEVKLVAR